MKMVWATVMAARDRLHARGRNSWPSLMNTMRFAPPASNFLAGVNHEILQGTAELASIGPEVESLWVM